MRANRIHRFGPPEVVEFEEIEIPMPRNGEVLLRVAAAGVGPWDALVRSGASTLGQMLPLTLGADLSGTVESPGDSQFEFGDEVFGVTNDRFTGAYAEYAVASSAKIARKPETLGLVESAAVPIVATTALQMLDRAGVGEGSRILVLGGAGGVGSAAVQLATLRGARVLATVNSHDLDYVRSLGARDVIDVCGIPLDRMWHDLDAVLDTVGGEAQRDAIECLRPGGAFVSAVSVPDRTMTTERRIDASWLLVDVNSKQLEDVAATIDAGRLRVLVGTTLSLAEARGAHEMLAGTLPRARGKIVLRATQTRS